MADISAIKLPNNTTLNLKDSSALAQLMFSGHELTAITRNGVTQPLDIGTVDTMNITELSAGNVIVTGAARFTNALYGNLLGNANTATTLQTGRTIQTNLASTSAATFDGSANITPGITGTLGVGNGGTGQTSAVNAANSFINALTTGDNTPQDNDYYISQYVGGGTTTTTYHRRKHSSLWTYIKGKADSTYATAAQGILAQNAMPKSGGTFTGAVTLDADPTGNLGAATKQYVDTQITNHIAASDAMVFKGTIGTNGTVTALPTSNVVVGDTYKCISAVSLTATQSYTGAAVTTTVGDLIVAMANSKWIVVPSGDETVTTIKYSTTTQTLTTSDQSGAITVGEAATKQVVTSIDTSAKLPTSNAVKTFVEGKNYVTIDHTHNYAGSSSAGGAANTALKLNQPVDITIGSKSNQFDGSSSIAFATSELGILKSDVGLGNVDNTADVDKPISTATQNALDTKASKTNSVYIVKGTQTETTASWTGNIDLDALYDGLTIAYYLPTTSASNVTLNLTLRDGTTKTGAIPVYYTGTTRATTHYGAGSTVILTYWSAGSISVNGTATTEARWTRSDYTVSNTNTVGEYAGSCTAGENGMARYSLIMQKSDGTWESFVLSSGTGTSKAKNTNGFLINSPILYQSAGTYASGDNAGQSACWYTVSFDTRYSTNGGSWSSAGKTFYIIGTITNGLFYLKDTTWWTHTLPTTEDGYYYIRIGQMYGAYQCTLAPEHPIFYYKNNKLRIYDNGSDLVFTGGTNKITISHLGTTESEDITVTPSIANNITGTGTSGCIAKFNGTNTLIDGPAFGTATTTFLRNDGTWVTPDDTKYTAGSGLSLSNSNEFSLATSGVSAGSAGPTEAVTGNDGTTVSIPRITVDAYGRVTELTSYNLTNKNTTYTAATAAPGKVASSSSTGTSTNYARQDHTHGIDLASGDANGQVKIAGSNVNVTGLKSAAYTESSAYATAAQGTTAENALPKTGGTMTGGITMPSDSSGWNAKGIIFSQGSRIGENTSGGLGVYAAEKLYLRPNSGTAASTADGVIIDGTGLYPSVTNTENLGGTSNKWANIYSTAGTFSGAVTGASFAASSYIAVNSGNSGTAGGIALYSTSPTDYGIAMRQTTDQGNHGFVQGDWATYFIMKGTNAATSLTRGWIFKNATTPKGVASIAGNGSAAFDGQIAVGTIGTDISGSVSLVMDRTLQCLNFVFN